jgi:uncharacterized protein (DUF983 family)
MELKPETLFVGVIDFFSVLLPGAVVAYLVKGPAEQTLFGSVFPKYPNEAAGWAVFVFGSYILGHFIFLAGSKLDETYDWLRKTEEIGPAAGFLRRTLAKSLFSNSANLAVSEVRKLKEECLPDVGNKPLVNAFQWAKARLTIECPAALSEIHRLEADSKFFRSLVVVLVVVAILVVVKARPAQPDWAVIGLCVALTVVSYWCYATRRFKATQHAYWYLLTLHACRPPIPRMESTSKA